MKANLTKIWQITRRLLYQNRWVYFFLMLWPFGMAAILLVPSSKPEADDVLSLLHQECLYGLGLVAFTGSALLGNEQRSRRTGAILSRAVSQAAVFSGTGERGVAAVGALYDQLPDLWKRLIRRHRQAPRSSIDTGLGRTSARIVDCGRGSLFLYLAAHDACVHGIPGSAGPHWLGGV